MGLTPPEPLVLVVDDEATVRQAHERALKLEGFAVSTAAGGHAALEEVAARPPAVVVLDVMMPDLDGVSEAKLERAFRNLRKDFRAGHDERKDDRAAGLAKALGISQAKVDAAFEQLRKSHEAEHEKMRDALAASLAKSLKLDEAKVKAALEDLAPERGLHRHP